MRFTATGAIRNRRVEASIDARTLAEAQTIADAWAQAKGVKGLSVGRDHPLLKLDKGDQVLMLDGLDTYKPLGAKG